MDTAVAPNFANVKHEEFSVFWSHFNTKFSQKKISFILAVGDISLVTHWGHFSFCENVFFMIRNLQFTLVCIYSMNIFNFIHCLDLMEFPNPSIHSSNTIHPVVLLTG